MSTSVLDPRLLRKIAGWRTDLYKCVRDIIDMEPTTQQVDALHAISNNNRVSIRSGHGCGKDGIAAATAWGFLSSRPYAKVVVTAPTHRQLHDVFRTELSKWFRKSSLQDEFVMQKDIVFHKSAPKEWWLRYISPQVKATKDEQAETLAGLHGDHLLLIVDEASGVPDPMFIPLEGALTQADNKVLLIGNMTKNTGYFYDTHFHNELSKNWVKLHWDSRESSLVTKEMVQFFADKYGEESSVFAIRVKGDPPYEDERTLIPLSWPRQCLGNDFPIAEDEPKYLGVDVARYGEDKSIIMPRQGLKIFPWETFSGLNTITLGGYINQCYIDGEAEGLAIDEIGVGAGVTDWLYKHGHLNVFGINVAEASSNIAEYNRLRDELWLLVREKCMKGLYNFPETPEGEELCNELASPTYDFNAHGGYIVESKKAMKLRGIMSPNIADALCLTEYFSGDAHRVWKKKAVKTANSNLLGQDIEMELSNDAWMVA
jgi:hypothetical protein